MNAAFQLTIEGAPTLAVHDFESFERAHVGGELVITARVADGETAPLVATELLGQRATLEVVGSDCARGVGRYFHGLVETLELSGGGARLTVVPRLMLLADGTDHRVFLDQDAVTIAEALLGEAGLSIELRVGSRPRPRVQCVQAFEAVLPFLRRILAEDGVALWVEHTEQEDVVVLGDELSSWVDLPGGAELRFRQGGGLDGDEAITALTHTRSLSHDGVAVSDYDPDKPAVDQGASVGGEAHPLFVYPGHHTSPDEGRTRARTLLEEAQSESLVLRATTTCRHVRVGSVVELTEAPDDAQNGRFRVVEVLQRGRDFGAGEGEPRYEAQFVATPADKPYRPRREPRASLGGLETMTVTGPPGQEIHTRDGGHIKAHFRWDRRSPHDDRASAWLRPLQPALGGGFFLPRTGWEVLVGFLSEPVASGDTPIELGRLVNGGAPPAEALPGQKVRSNWGTQSTPGGGKQNQLRFDDAAGSEGMHVNASANYNERTENDKVTTVTADDTNLVGGNHVNTVTLQQGTSVAGAQSYSVGGNRDLSTVGVLGISAASEVVTVGATRDFSVGGDYETKAASVSRFVGAAENVVAIQETNRHVSGASTIAVGGTWAEIGGVSASIGVLGASTLTVGGPLSIRATNVSINATTLSETYAGLYSGQAGGKLTLSAPTVKLQAGGALKAKGADVFFKASSKITVKAGGVTITITPGSITVKGKLKGDSTSVVTTKEEVG
jgi:type VI secretion system secreted protein VgrG